MTIAELAAAAAGGGVGASARMWVLLRVAGRGRSTSAALSVINISGSAAAGAIVAARLDPALAALLLSGVLGSFTTLSAWVGDLTLGAERSGAALPTARAVIELAAGVCAAAVAFTFVS